MSDVMTTIIAALRGKGNPDNPALKPIEQHRDGYRMYRQVQQSQGEDVMPYEEWIKQETPNVTGR